MSQPDLIIHDEKDNVGVVVIEKTKKGQDCNAWIMENDKTIKVNSTNEIPLGHKIALKDLKEGDTILNDLVLKSKNPSIKKIRAGKILKFTIESTDKKNAEKTVQNICQELRIFNPLVSNALFEPKTI